MYEVGQILHRMSFNLKEPFSMSFCSLKHVHWFLSHASFIRDSIMSYINVKLQPSDLAYDVLCSMINNVSFGRITGISTCLRRSRYFGGK
mgnify:CR=1 FL=1